MVRAGWVNGGSIQRDFWLGSFGSMFGTYYVGIEIWTISFFLRSPLYSPGGVVRLSPDFILEIMDGEGSFWTYNARITGPHISR